MKSLFLVIIAMLVAMIATVDAAPVLQVADPGRTPIEFIEHQIKLLSQLVTTPIVYVATVVSPLLRY